MSEISFYNPALEPFLIPMSGREIEVYRAQFGEEVISGPGSLLDIGAGTAELRSDPVTSLHVVKLDPQYRDSHLLERPAVAGLGEWLPFPDNSFDRVIASWSIFHILDDEYKTKAIAEALRVARDSVHIHPLLLDIDAGDKFFPIPWASYKRTGIEIPIASTEGLTLELDKRHMLNAIRGRNTLEEVAGTIARRYPLDLFKFETVKHTRLLIQALIESKG